MSFLGRAIVVLSLASCSYGFDRVLLVRHCTRSMYPTLRGRGDPDFDYASNYTAKAFPTNEEWEAGGVAQCTQRGKEIAELFGKSLFSKGILPAPVTVVADNVSRCATTAEQMVKGLNSVSHSYATYSGVTKTLAPSGWPGMCSSETAEDRIVSMQNMIKLAESGTHYLSKAWKERRHIMAELQDVVGKGEAPSILDIPDKIADIGRYVGGLHVSSQGMVENFILEAGAGLPVAWGALDNHKDRRNLWDRFSLLNILYNRINHNGIAPATRDGAVVVDVLQQLQNTRQGSLVLVGHDTNVDNAAALLNLTWSCGPYVDNASPPHIGLLFEKADDGVKIKAICTALDDSDELFPSPGEVILGQVRKGETAFTISPVDPLIQEARAHINKFNGSDCIGSILEQPLYTVVV